MSERRELVLEDGRLLEMVLSGAENGMPLIFHHGTPGASTPFRAVARAARARGLTLVTFSRPGYGSSSRLPGRAVVDVVADTAAVLGSIGAERCLVAGWSGGGPHALACAARLKEAAATLVIAGVAPFDAPELDFVAGMGEDNLAEFGAAIEGEQVLRGYLGAVREHLRETTVEQLSAALSSLLPAVDRAVLTDEFGEDMVASFTEALRPGVDGWLDDDLAFVKPWGFALEEIGGPTLLWHGSADLMVPFAHGQALASALPGATAHLLPDEGHLSISIGALDAMLDELVATAQ